ncbi:MULTISPECIES: hypothetical protein [unclassified Streptomyces]|uniref:hypothetical protein n=1 Tax=unclassified Streptomyces TaxID=2593676 RepID=UPI00037A159B|nr:MULTISPECIES: hypothetical protein [unclassified Streptomyces]MYT32619.1 hypothetical protein [Streptomyces sp. SID8354]
MVTARSPFGMRRARFSAGPVGLLCLFAALLALVFSHGLSAESGDVHLPAAVADAGAGPGAGLHPSAAEPAVAAGPAVSVAEPGQPHHEHPDGHPTGACLSGQPPQGAALQAPDQSPLDRCAATSTRLVRTVVDASSSHAMPSAQTSVARSAVLLI